MMWEREMWVWDRTRLEQRLGGGLYVDKKARLHLERLCVSTQAQGLFVSVFGKALLGSNSLPAAVTLAFL